MKETISFFSGILYAVLGAVSIFVLPFIFPASQRYGLVLAGIAVIVLLVLLVVIVKKLNKNGFSGMFFLGGVILAPVSFIVFSVWIVLGTVSSGNARTDQAKKAVIVSLEDYRASQGAYPEKLSDVFQGKDFDLLYQADFSYNKNLEGFDLCLTRCIGMGDHCSEECYDFRTKNWRPLSHKGPK